MGTAVANLGGGGGTGGMCPPFLWYALVRKSLPRVTYERGRNAIKRTASITSFFSSVGCFK